MHRWDKCGTPPRAAILRAQLRRDHLDGAIGGAADPGRKRIAPRQFVAGSDRQGKLIVALRRVLLPQKIAREAAVGEKQAFGRSEEHTSELQSLMRISYAVFCLKKKKHKNHTQQINTESTRTTHNSAKTLKAVITQTKKNTRIND